MNQLWQISIDDYLKVVEIAKEFGRKPGESIEDIFLAYMEIKGQKPIGANEFTKDELLQQFVEKNGTILDISTDDKGKQSFSYIRKKETPS